MRVIVQREGGSTLFESQYAHLPGVGDTIRVEFTGYPVGQYTVTRREWVEPEGKPPYVKLLVV